MNGNRSWLLMIVVALLAGSLSGAFFYRKGSENDALKYEEQIEELYKLINNMPQPDPAEVLRQQARQSEQTAVRESVLEDLKAQRERAELEEKAKRRPHIIRRPEERERV